MNQLKRLTYNTSAPIDEMLFMNERFKPSMAVPIKVTVTIPMTMPSVVSTERSLFARMALQEIASPSRSSVRKFIGDWMTGLVDEWMAGVAAHCSSHWSRASSPEIRSAEVIYFPLHNAV